MLEQFVAAAWGLNDDDSLLGDVLTNGDLELQNVLDTGNDLSGGVGHSDELHWVHAVTSGIQFIEGKVGSLLELLRVNIVLLGDSSAKHDSI